MQRFTRLRVAPLALILLIAAGLVPQGWMPRAAAGQLGMVICTAQGLVAAPADWGGPEDPQDKAAAGERGPCAFAGLGVPVLPPAPAVRVGHVRVLDSGRPPTGPPADPGRPLRHRLPPAQAPPAQA